MVFAKTSKAAARLSEAVRERKIEKEYICIVDLKNGKRARNIRRLFIKKSSKKYKYFY